MRSFAIALAILLPAGGAAAQSLTQPTTEGSAAIAASLAKLADVATDEWAFSLSAYAYFVPDDEDYVQPTFAIDHEWLHLEARYNYEDLDTASVWLGYNFSFGAGRGGGTDDENALTLDVTPMVGGVFGDTRGIAPGYEITLAWRKLELYTEGEYLFDFDDSSDNFFYSWSELTYALTDWFRAGVAVQRTKIRSEASDFEVGPMVGFTHKGFDLSAYLLYPEEEDHPTVVLGASLEF